MGDVWVLSSSLYGVRRRPCSSSPAQGPCLQSSFAFLSVAEAASMENGKELAKLLLSVVVYSGHCCPRKLGASVSYQELWRKPWSWSCSGAEAAGTLFFISQIRADSAQSWGLTGSASFSDLSIFIKSQIPRYRDLRL